MKVAAVATLLALVLTGCSSSGDPTEDPPRSDAPSQDATGSSPEDPAESPTESPTATPTVEPASGPVLDVDGVSVRLPRGWRVRYDTAVSGTGLGKQGLIFVSVFAGPERPLRALIREDLRLTGPVTQLRRADDTTLGGNPAYHYTARATATNLRDSFGTWDDGDEVIVQFDLHDDRSAAERRELVESVLATYTS